MVELPFGLEPVAAVTGGATALFTYWAMNAVKPFPPGLPIAPKDRIPNTLHGKIAGWLMQHAYVMQYNQGLTLPEETQDKLGPTPYGMRMFNQGTIVTANAQDATAILTDQETFSKSRQMKFLSMIIGNGLVTQRDVDVHRSHRQICNPAFSAKAIGNIARDSMSGHTLALRQAIQNAPTTESGHKQMPVKELIARTALNIIAEAAFHTDADSMDEIASLLFKMNQQGFTPLGILPGSRYFLKSSRNRLQYRAEVGVHLSQIVNKIKGELSTLDDASKATFSAEGKGKALLDYLVLSDQLSETALMDHSLTFMFAGHETSSNTIQWAIALLANNPEVQEKLFEEIQDVVALGGTPSDDDLKQCEYLDNVIKETLRIFPVAALIPRLCTTDTVLPGSKQFVPAGAQLQVQIFNMHRNPEIFGKDAKVFRPDRWAQLEKDPRATSAFMPFSVGPRNCIGKEFAMAEVRMLLATLVRNYELRWPEGQKFPHRKMSVTLAPREAFEVIFVPR